MYRTRRNNRKVEFLVTAAVVLVAFAVNYIDPIQASPV